MTRRRRTIAVVSVSRADYAICLPVLRRITADPDLKLHLIVGGMHLSPDSGTTVQEIIGDGIMIGDRVDMLLSSDTPEGIAKSMGLGTIGFAHVYARVRPDLLLVAADRFEMHAAAVAAVPFQIPVAHIEGGDLTEGAIDDGFRHSITKLSHLHFVSTTGAARRVRQMGEEAWRISVSGAPSLDNAKAFTLLSKDELERKYKLALQPPSLLVTFHPVTREYDESAGQIAELLAALERCDVPIIFTLPNADTHGRLIADRIRDFVNIHSSARLIENFGARDYWSVMSYAGAMVGNSSSGLIEAPSLKLPVVNIGNRQRGRERARNVIDVGYGRHEIIDGIRKALDPVFREGLRDLVNPYGSGNASEIIVERLRTVDLSDRALLAKRFCDIAC